MRSGKAAAVLLTILGGLLTVVAGGRRWLVLTVSDPDAALGVGEVAVTGREAVPVAVALGLVAVAGGVVLTTAGRLLRRVVAVLLALGGAGVVVATVTLGSSRDALLRDAFAQATGAATDPPAGSVQALTVWPYLSAAGGLLVVVAALVVLARGRRWDAPSRRFESPAARAAAARTSERDAAFDAWDALSAGDDPTDAAPDAARDAASGTGPGAAPGDDDATSHRR